MPWPLFGLLAVVLLLPLGAYGLSVLRVRTQKRRMLPQWSAFARSHGALLVERGRSLELELPLARVVATRHARPRHLGGVHWARWETVVSVRAPADWPPALELYGRRAISEIVTTRRRVSIEPDFDRTVLVRDRDGEAAEQARQRLHEPAVRDDVARILATASEMWLADGQIHSRLPGLASPEVIESRILGARKLRQRLAGDGGP